MRPDSGDAAYLWDMREHARHVIEMVAGIDLKQYARDQKTRMAVERGIEIIGEAARHIVCGSSSAPRDPTEPNHRPAQRVDPRVRILYGRPRHATYRNCCDC